ncbi:MAG: hypothetical protein CMF56_09860 [Leifsonia sp.]|nr:hypothetical protein [Leifsonia sp.]
MTDQTPYTVDATTALRAPAGTSTSTPWIWVIALVPLLSVIPAMFIDWRGILTISLLYPSDPAAQFALFTDPGYLSTVLLGIVATAILVLGAYFDHKQLKARGVPQPFAWPWMLFVFVAGGNLVYVIGRSVVVRRRTGGGLAPLWATIAVHAVSLVVGIVIMSIVFSTVFEFIRYYG